MAREFNDGGRVSAPSCQFHAAKFEIVNGASDEEDTIFYRGRVTENLPATAAAGSKTEAVGPHKPPLPVKPPIWAESRQEVCEALDVFRSFQGGVYQSGDVVKGYLLGGHSSSRDIFHHGGRLIISHGGGKAEALHSRNGRREIQGPGDQLEDDLSVRALLNTYKNRRPLVLLADDSYALFPYELKTQGYTYIVLGFYWITHAWAELQQISGSTDVVRYKFAFQWCGGQDDPWWPSSSSDPNHHVCPHCKMKSPVVYQAGRMCLKPKCSLFWKVGVPKRDELGEIYVTPPVEALSYSSGLLTLRPTAHLEVSSQSIFSSRNDDPIRPFAKGIHCKECGRLSTRYKWENWECSHCHRIYEAPRITFNHKDFWLQEQTIKYYQHHVTKESGIVPVKMDFRDREKGSALPYVQTFVLPENRGRVHLIAGHPTINRTANELFVDYQNQAARGEIQFRRWPLRSVSKGQLLSNYFSQNSKASTTSFVCPHYIGGAERTTPLEGGPEAVIGALNLIKERVAAALGHEPQFNEVLSAAYMEKQRMAGDVVVMEGAGVQEFYEHAVFPRSFRIVATARCISPENYAS
ncbi:hypothetical protein BC834DRAFT_823305 [Gloeopeniophorella convolvens]|nr:hypothetical protein BC834DRAFT_823305 [Gloeopeniophorella convolvens]